MNILPCLIFLTICGCEEKNSTPPISSDNESTELRLMAQIGKPTKENQEQTWKNENKMVYYAWLEGFGYGQLLGAAAMESNNFGLLFLSNAMPYMQASWNSSASKKLFIHTNN